MRKNLAVELKKTTIAAIAALALASPALRHQRAFPRPFKAGGVGPIPCAPRKRPTGVKMQAMGIQQIGEGRAALEIWSCGYRAPCSSPSCQNLARVILRRVAPGGAADGQSEFCHQHARTGIAKAKASGLSVFDMRTTVRQL
jgi:hypothetical protein